MTDSIFRNQRPPVPMSFAEGLNKGPERLPSLDGFRAVGIALVLGWHLNDKGAVPGTQIFSERTGTLGVQIFFVLSGFLITKLLLDEEAQSGSVSLKSFY